MHAENPVALLGGGEGVERLFVAAHVLVAAADILVHHRGQQLRLLLRRNHVEFARTVQGVKDGLTGIERLLVKSQLEEHDHQSNLGAQSLKVLAEGNVPVVGGSGHTQRRVELAVLGVRPGADVVRARDGCRGAGAVRHVRAQGGQALGFARIAVCQPVCSVEQPIQPVRIKQAPGLQERRPLLGRGQGQQLLYVRGVRPLIGRQGHGS